MSLSVRQPLATWTGELIFTQEAGQVMPSRLRFVLEPCAAHTPKAYQHAIGLQSLLFYDRDGFLSLGNLKVADRYHDDDKACPGTISPLEVLPDGRYAFEVTLLSKEVEEAFAEGVQVRLKKNPKIMLGRDQFFCHFPEYLEQLSFDDLWDGAISATELQLLFFTPTTNHLSTARPQPKKYSPLPDPWRYFRSWHQSWYTAEPRKNQESFLAESRLQIIVNNYVEIVDFQGRTEPLSFLFRLKREPPTLPAAGFLGQVTFQILQGAVTEQEKRCLATLARYADFCGTGIGKALGLGQTKLAWAGTSGQKRPGGCRENWETLAARFGFLSRGKVPQARRQQSLSFVTGECTPGVTP